MLQTDKNAGKRTAGVQHFGKGFNHFKFAFERKAIKPLDPAYGEGTLAYIMAKKGFKNNSHDQYHVP